MKYFKCNAFSYFREDFPKVALYPHEGNSFPKYLKYEVFFFFGGRFSEVSGLFNFSSARREFFFKIFKMRSVCLF